MTLVYDDGVFKPQGPVPAIKNHAVVHVLIVEETEPTAAANDDDATGWATAMELIGCLKDKDGATDVARNHDKYLYDKA